MHSQVPHHENIWSQFSVVSGCLFCLFVIVGLFSFFLFVRLFWTSVITTFSFCHHFLCGSLLIYFFTPFWFLTLSPVPCFQISSFFINRSVSDFVGSLSICFTHLPSCSTIFFPCKAPSVSVLPSVVWLWLLLV